MSEQMKALYINAYGGPETYILGQLPKPTITKPTQVLIKVHAASLNPVDIISATGALKMVRQEPFPYKIGFDVSGVVEAVGADVKKFKVGEEVLSRVPQDDKGSFAQYVVTDEFYIARKPSNLSHEEASCIPLVGVTSYQALRRIPGGLEGVKGKTILVPAALGGAGSMGLQIAKNLGAAKVITTASTGKLTKAKELFDGKADEIIDYKAADPVKVIPEKSVDFIYDTIGQPVPYMPLLKKGGTMVSIAALPSGTEMRDRMPNTPWYMYYGLNAVHYWKYERAAKQHGINFSYMFLQPNGEDLQVLVDMAEKGDLKPVVGEVVDFEGEGAEANVRDACARQKSGAGAKNGGKIVFKIA